MLSSAMGKGDEEGEEEGQGDLSNGDRVDRYLPGTTPAASCSSSGTAVRASYLRA